MNDFESRIEEARKLIAGADCILIGAGAGLSAAAGLRYDGEEFRREFRPWIEKYGIRDLYSSSFYPFPTPEERWAYWARHIWFSRFRIGATPLYRELLRIVEGRDYFVITTNTDAQFQKAGFSEQRLFYTQGDYAYLQDATGDDTTLYYNENLVRRMMEATADCRIPTALVPRDPLNGHDMSVNLRCDGTFVEDGHWHDMQRRYSDFVRQARGRRLVMIELGVGFNTPGIIRFPFEWMARELSGASLIRFNRDYPQPSLSIPRRFVAFSEELSVELLSNFADGERANEKTA